MLYMVTISVVNNKGGVGKTTTVHNIGVGLANEGYKVGLIDFDSQANLSMTLKFEHKTDLKTALLKRKALEISDFSQTLDNENLYILPNLKDTTSQMFAEFSDIERLDALRNILTLLDFDFLLIDTPPNLDIQTYNSMITSNYILVPVEYDIYSVSGLKVLVENIDKIKARMNPNLELLGILVTKVDERESINKPIHDILKRDFDEKVFKTFIHTNKQFKHAQVNRLNIFNFRDRKGSNDYHKLTKEILKRIK